MRQSIAALSFLAAMAGAADTVEFFFPGGSEGVDPVASIIEQSPSTTVMRLSCPTGVDSTECGWGPGLEYSILSSTSYQATMSDEGFSMSFGCNHNVQKAVMTCVAAMQGRGDPDGPQTETATLSGTEIDFLTATITATNSAAPTSSGAASLALASSPSPVASVTAPASGSATGASQPASSPTSATGSAAPAESTGGAYRFGVEASALLALVGAAAMNVW